MKKIAVFFVACFALVMMSCSGGNTPSAVAEKTMKCIIDKDYEGFADQMYIPSENEDSIKLVKNLIVTGMKMSMDKMLAEKKGLKECKATSEKIEGDNAIVKMKMTYGDGTSDESDMKLTKDKKGNWKMDLNK